MAFFLQIMFFLLRITCRMLRAKAKDESFQENGTASNGIESRTIPIWVPIRDNVIPYIMSFVMIVICQVALKQTMAFVVDEKPTRRAVLPRCQPSLARLLQHCAIIAGYFLTLLFKHDTRKIFVCFQRVTQC